MSFMQNPSVAQGIGQNPMAQQIMASIQAHIAEHVAFKYRKEIEEKLGAPLPPPGSQLHEEVEVQLSRLVADASAQLTQKKQKEMAQKQAMQKAQDPQDPQVQKEQAEMQLKAGELQRKQQKDQMDHAVAMEKLKLEREDRMEDNKLDREKFLLDKMTQG
jgi:hypothetical protein